MLTLPSSVETCVASLHPAFAMRGAKHFMPEIHRTIRRAVNWARGQGRLCRPDVHFPSLAELRAVVANTRALAIDVETPRGDSSTIEILGIAPLDRGDIAGYAIPWSDAVCAVMQPVLESADYVKVGHNFAYDMNAFRAYGIEPVAPVYDTIQAGALLWPPQPRSKQSTETSGIRWLSLAACVLRVLDGVAYWKQPADPTTRQLYRAAWPEVRDALHPLLYCGLDSAYTGMLWLAVQDLLQAVGMRTLYADIVAPAGLVLSRCETRGMLIDPNLREQLIEESRDLINELEGRISTVALALHQERLAALQTAIDTHEAAITARCDAHPDYRGRVKRTKCPTCLNVYGVAKPHRNAMRVLAARMKHLGPEFKPGSDDHWRWLLFDRLGLKAVSVTKTKRQPQVDDASIVRLARRYPQHDILQHRVALQHARHRLSGPLALEVDAANRIHFGYSLQTATGRISSGANREDDDKPRLLAGNAQNLSDRDRRMFIAPPGHVLVQADWSQAEMRVEAWLARETAMLQAWIDGVDIHSMNALDIAVALGRRDVTLDNVRTSTFMFGGEEKSFRQAGKTLGLALIYGLGPWKMSKMFSLPIGHCERIHAAFFARWRAIAAFQRELVTVAERDRVVVTPFGRQLPVRNFVWSDDEQRWVLGSREAVLAYPAQSVVGDMLKAVLPAADAIEGAILDTTTHDSLRFTVPERLLDGILPQIRRLMECEWPKLGTIEGFGTFRCPADMAIGSNWGKRHPTENPEGLREIL